MTHRHLPTVKSRVLMDIWGYWLQTSKTATSNHRVYLSQCWQISTKGGLFKELPPTTRTKIGSSSANNKYVWFLLDNFRLSGTVLSQLLHVQQPRNELLLFVSLSNLWISRRAHSHNCCSELSTMRACSKRRKSGRHQNCRQHTLAARLLHKNATPFSSYSSAKHEHSKLR